MYEESLKIERRLGDPWAIAISLDNLGGVAYDLGAYAEARAFFEESLDLFRQIGDRRGSAYLLEGLAAVTVAEGDAVAGARLWGAANALRDQTGALLSPQECVQQETRLGRARQALSEKAFAVAFAEGRALTWEQAVEEALKKRSPS